jgi:hypothetical protein
MSENIATGPDVTVGPSTQEPLFQYGGSYLRSSVQAFQHENIGAGNPREELKQYLESSVEETMDIPGWWGVSYYLSDYAHVSHVYTTRPPRGTQP